MKKTKILYFVLALAFIITSFSLSVFAENMESGTCGDNLTWAIDYEGTLTISGTGKMSDYGNYDSRPWNSYKSEIKKVEMKFEIPENIVAPVHNKEVVGKITYILNGKEIGTSEIYVAEDIDEITIFDIFCRILSNIFGI